MHLNIISCFIPGEIQQAYHYGGGSSTGVLKQTPKIISGDQIFTAELGETLILPCQVAHLQDFVLMWKQGTRVLTADKLVVRKDPRLTLKDDHSLVIDKLRPEDQGTYTCEVDIMGKPESIKHTVGVLYTVTPL